MRITALETIQVAAFSNLVWVRIETDEGLTGLGETFRNAEATVAYLHETAAPYLLGQDPMRIRHHAHMLRRRVSNHFFGYPSRSVELRGNSAVDLALWDIKGQALQVHCTKSWAAAATTGSGSTTSADQQVTTSRLGAT